ncbi:helix-turn-helix transcriptional regulator [Streptomyces sp. DSM 44915]|uniref:Helix-turn-helix transcriptional regulator n=1 Tax=Streptomyces chisholmiae TaxID=3075540 RepID=A0ABU2JUC9_9ACTN|nr:helix-turn-helix transcriptional regulator [Streptomyces sp. DSM 44915]MDT0268129.1 helix-turn-helix transcriptional regulator [Streptomyces sp. DSM 44915]
MPPRENPTARQARLGAELRKLRVAAGRTARETAAMLGTDQGKISHIESGRIGVSEERIRRLADFYACTDESLLEALCVIAREHRGQFWWDEYRGTLASQYLAVAELEHHAVAMRSLQTVTVPGLLQTEEYARALFRGGLPAPTDDQVDARVRHRMRRKAVLEREDPPLLSVFLHEAALHMRFGGRGVARRQLESLIETSELPQVTLRVIPFTNEDFYEVTQPVLYVHGVVPQLDTVLIDGPTGSGLLGADDELAHYRVFFGHANDRSLDQEESRQLIHHIARTL